jgi:hypothetical protein
MHSSRNEALDCCCGNRSSAHYYIHVTLCDYKYAFRLAQMTISHSSFSRLGFRFLALGLLALENKRSTKRSRSPSAERSPSPSESKTPLLVPSGSPTPPRSPSEISSCRPHSPVFEQGGSSGNVPVIDLSSSSDEQDFIADISWDAEFTRWLFGDLNRDVLGPPGDGKVIILSGSNKEEEAR